MGRRRCCCECYEFTDLFDRADSTNVGADWEECSGDWQIWGGHLRGCDLNATITLKQMVGEQVGHLQTDIHIRTIPSIPPDPYEFSSVGAKYRILIFYGAQGSPCGGAGNPWIAELEITSTIAGTMRLIDPNGVTWMSSPCSFGGLYTNLDVCVSEEEIMVSCADASYTIYGCTDPMNGFYFALQSGTTTCTYWDSVFYQDHFDHNMDCPDCLSPCCCPCIESQQDLTSFLTATIYAPNCSNMHGVSTTMTGSAALPECPIWTGDAVLGFQCATDDPFCAPFLDYELAVVLRCLNEEPGGNCTGFQLELSWPLGSDNYGFCYNVDWTDLGGGRIGRLVNVQSGCSCDPFYLMFGPFRLRGTPSIPLNCCNCCDEFYIVITETP